MGKSLTDFYEMLGNNPEFLKNIKYEKKKYSDDVEGNYKFINEVIVPFAKKNGYNFDLNDFVENELNSRKLDAEDLEDVTGGISRKTFATLGIVLFSGSLLSGLAIKNNLIPMGSISSSASPTIQVGKKTQKESEESYKKRIEEEVQTKKIAQEKGLYPKSSGDTTGQYGYGEYSCQAGKLEIPSGAEIIELNGPFLKSNKFKNFQVKNREYNKNSPLFRHKACIQDIKQGALECCYFFATVQAAMSSGMEIEETMVDNKDGSVTVKFYKNDPSNPGELKAVYYKLKKQDSIVINGNSTSKVINMQKHVIWPQTIFGAYVGAKQDLVLSETPEIGNENGEFGNPDSVFKHVFGLKNSEYLEISKGISKSKKAGEYSKEELDLFNTINDSMQKNQPMCCGSRSKEDLTNKSIHDNHAFAIVNLEETNGEYRVILADPLGGEVSFELHDFAQNFASINIGKN
ncbi:MAG: hypothetical protein LBI55_03820 [Oscillospiraceae bacterium]|jgi:hypothetical protein|nr:hypothetical protein [Oscillospiraceae bacterium]